MNNDPTLQIITTVILTLGSAGFLKFVADRWNKVSSNKNMPYNDVRSDFKEMLDRREKDYQLMREDIKSLRKELGTLQESYSRLEEENEYLKKQLKEFKNSTNKKLDLVNN